MDSGDLLIKRVIATPGDKIRLEKVGLDGVLRLVIWWHI